MVVVVLFSKVKKGEYVTGSDLLTHQLGADLLEVIEEPLVGEAEYVRKEGRIARVGQEA